MEVIATDDYFVFQNVQKGETNLWCCRRSGRFELRPSWALAGQENPECLGIAWALYGKLIMHPELPERLVLVRRCDRICEIPFGFDPPDRKYPVYRVVDVVTLPILHPSDNSSVSNISLSSQLRLKPCPKHHAGIIEGSSECVHGCRDSSPPKSSFSASPFGKIPHLGDSLKLLATDTLKSTAGNAAALASQVKVSWKASTSRPATADKRFQRYERRILEEILKLFNAADSFYFSLSGDITSSLRRSYLHGETDRLSGLDDRFFFNKALLGELLEMEDPAVLQWITPFIQGYVERLECPLEDRTEFYKFNGYKENHLPDFYAITIISRRSRHRAGTRYKRRGLDDEGHVANYVETEQIVTYHHYALSFLQVRGSVPIFWSQPGYKYRPPPQLDRSPNDDFRAFSKHFDQEFSVYGVPIVCINLAEKFGRERVISEAYFDNALRFDNPNLSFVAFDFHDACRGMCFENVSLLTEAIADLVAGLCYTWLDRHGIVCTQKGVVRINCIDCLDRTNVVQTALAKKVLESQLSKLGVIPPEQDLPESTRAALQTLWANNGDALSRQYAGTNALKGDFTRTGERNLSGLMKDGMNSASRYYLNQFRDAYRQTTIDLMTGQIVGETLMGSFAGQEDDDESTPEFSHQEDLVGDKETECEYPGVGDEDELKAEQVKAVIEDCKKLLIPDMTSIVGAWPLIDSDPVMGDPSQEDMDIIFILARDSYYVAHYDDDVDKVTRYQRVAFRDVESIELGIPEESSLSIAFRRSSARGEHNLRINYRMPELSAVSFHNAYLQETATLEEQRGSITNGVSGYFHMFRATNLRFFNNLAFCVKSEEERVECLKPVAESLAMAMKMSGIDVEVNYVKLIRKKSKIPRVHSNYNDTAVSVRGGVSGAHFAAQAFKGGVKVFSNMTWKLNPLSKLKQSKKSPLQTEDVCAVSQDLSVSYPDESSKPSVSGRTNPNILINQEPSVEDNNSIPFLVERCKVLVSDGDDKHQRLRCQLFPRLSRSSEDVSGGGESGGSSASSLFVSLDTWTKSKGSGSLQMDLDKVPYASGKDGASTGEFGKKEAWSSFAKLTKGIQDIGGAVISARTKINDNVLCEQEKNDEGTVDVSRGAGSNQIVTDYLSNKLSVSESRTKVLLL